MAEEVMLTTIDNPYNPFTDYDEWFSYDQEMGYNTCELLARVANASEELSDEDNEEIIYEAMKEICKYNISGVHRLIKANEVIDPNKVQTNLAFKLNEEIKNKKSS